MSNFAKVVNGVVVDMIVADQAHIDTLPDASDWVSAPDNPAKGYRATIGESYDSVNKIFIRTQPYPSWSLDANSIWQPPTPQLQGYCWWDEPSKSWKTL